MTGLEIEFKFTILPSQHERLSETLTQLSSESHRFQKLDDYFRAHKKINEESLNRENTSHVNCSYANLSTLDVRIRNHEIFDIDGKSISRQTVLTYKRILQSEGNVDTRSKGELNLEYETEIEDSEMMATLLQDLGAIHYIFKEKLGHSYIIPITSTEQAMFSQKKIHILAELSHVRTLGVFLELEILMPKDTKEIEINQCRDLLLTLADSLGLSRSQIEPRRYMDMLREHKS